MSSAFSKEEWQNVTLAHLRKRIKNMYIIIKSIQNCPRVRSNHLLSGHNSAPPRFSVTETGLLCPTG